MNEELMAKARQMRAAGVPIAEIEKYIQSKLGAAEPVPVIPPIAADATAALQRERPSASGDFEAITAPGQGRVLMEDVLPALASHAMNTAQGVPGVRQLQAAIGSGASKFTDSPMSYRESMTALDRMTDDVPSDLRTIEQLVGGSTIPRIGSAASKAAGYFVPPGVKRAATVAGAAAAAGIADLPVLRGFVRGARRGSRMWNAGKAAASKTAPTAEAVAPKAPQTLDDIVGHMDLVPESAPTASAPRSLEQAIETASGKAFKPRGRTKAQFDYFADRMAKRAAGEAAGDVADLPLEQLLEESLSHIRQGGSLKSASEALKLVRRP